MRVVAGKCRSLPLKTLPGNNTRPTTDRIKETLFNIIQTRVPDSRFLDLFAGSGGIGIEALSRGAEFCLFIDQDRRAAKIIQENLAFTKLAPQARVVCADAVSALRRERPGRPFDVVFMDPPYGKGLERQALEELHDSPLITEDTLIIVEASLETPFDYLEEAGYRCIRRKQYRTNTHMFLRKAHL